MATVTSNDGKALKTPVEVPFQVVNLTDDIQLVYSLSSGIFTNITVTTSPDVHRVTVGGEDMDYKGNNRFKASLIDAKPGSTVSIVSYDGDNKRLETKKYKLGVPSF
ncbi:hypothetical protein [Sporosarcina sp. FSL K6-1508]|uniref:hypothetical protein n=1 Tax=Sporosarcina sp. FSL K6-1508 TaxID=2921553 RepID=UPI0030F61E47